MAKVVLSPLLALKLFLPMSALADSVTLQQGVNGYAGTADTHLLFSNPDFADGNSTAVVVDTSFPFENPGPAHGLLVFSNLVGTGANQIPAGSTINSVTLRLHSSDVTASSVDAVNVHRMIAAWSEASTWNSMSNGISANNVDARSTPDISFTPSSGMPQFTTSLLNAALATTVQAWIDGTSTNAGWAFLPTGSDEYLFDSSEHATISFRPSLTVDFTRPVPPSITSGPTSQTICPGANATFTVTATGTAPLRYYWRFNGAVILGAPNSASYSVTSAQSGNAGSYSVIVSNSFGTTTSVNGTLTVLTNTSATGPVATNVCQGVAANFSTLASGTGPFTYAWKLDGNPTGGNSPNLSVATGALSVGNHTVQVTVSGACGLPQTNSTLFTVNPTPTPTISASGPTAFCQGGGVTLTASAASSYRWSPGGQTTPSITVSSSGNYSVTVTNASGCQGTSAATTVTVNPNPGCSVNGPNQVCAGSAGNTYLCTTTGGATHSWTISGNGSIAGSTNGSSISVTAGTAGTFTVVDTVTLNGCVSPCSEVVTVYPKPSVTLNSPQTCSGQSAMMTATASGGAGPYHYTWTVPAGASNPGDVASFSASVSGNYAVLIIDNDSCRATATGSLTVVAPPAITTQPQSQTVVDGSNVTFTVAASGSPPLAYQWSKNGLALTGATDSTLSIASASQAEAGDYRVYVTNCSGAVTSVIATLTVDSSGGQGFRITNVRILASGLIRVEHTANTNSYYVLYRGSSITDISTPIVAALGEGPIGELIDSSSRLGRCCGFYHVRQSPLGEYFDGPPLILLQPASQEIEFGSSALFIVTAIGTQPLTYQWYAGNTPITGATSRTLALSAATISEAGSYSVKVSNPRGTVTSSPATLRVRLPLADTRYESPPGHSTADPCRCGGNVGPMVPMYLYPATGEFHLEAEELRLKSVGLDLVWETKYRSRFGPDTALGNRWDFNYNAFIERFGSNVIVHANTRADIYYRQSDGTHAAHQFFRVGQFDTNGAFELIFQDNGRQRFNPLDGSASQGKLSKIITRNTNTLSLSYDPAGRLTLIADDFGRFLTLTYDPSNRIASVFDSAGRRVVYSHNASGDLVSVTSPVVTNTANHNDFPLGKTTRYTYSEGLSQEARNHQLLTITDPSGQTWMQNVYSVSTNSAHLEYGRLLAQTLGKTNETIAYSYAAMTASTTNNFATLKAIRNNRSGEVSEWQCDAANRLVLHRAFTGYAVPGLATTDYQNRPVNKRRSDDPDRFETKYEYNRESLLGRTTFPEGNYTERHYEGDANPAASRRSHANLLTLLRLPGPRCPAQPPLVLTFTYATDLNTCGCGQNFPIQFTDAQGCSIRYSYDAAGNLTNTIYQDPTVKEKREFDRFGRETARIAPNGRRDERRYYTAGPQAGYPSEIIRDAGGSRITNHFEYNAAGKLVLKTDGEGNTTTFAVNALDQLLRETLPVITKTNPSGTIRSQKDFIFDLNNNLVQTVISNIDEAFFQTNTAIITGTEFDMLHKPIQAVRTVNGITNRLSEIVYDPEHRPVLLRHGTAVSGEQPNNAVRIEWDERGWQFRTIRGPGDPGQSTTEYGYDANGNVAVILRGTECIPRRTTTVHDCFDRLISVTDPMGNVAAHTYDPNGNRLSTRVDGELLDVPGSAGNVRLVETHYFYDCMNRLKKRDILFFDPATQSDIDGGHSETFIDYYDSSNQLRAVYGDTAYGAQYAYDSAGNVCTVSDELGLNEIFLTYDRKFRIKTRIDEDHPDFAGGQREDYLTTYDYDERGNPARITDNVGNATWFHPDWWHYYAGVTDARGYSVSTSYLAKDQPHVTRRDWSATVGGTVSSITLIRDWDTSGRLTAETDANGNGTGYDRDPLDRVFAVHFADGTVNLFTNDCHSNVVATVDANQTEVRYLYDLNDRLTSTVVIPGPGVSSDITFEQYRYYGPWRLIALASNNVSIVTRSYDSLLNQTLETLNGRSTASYFNRRRDKIMTAYPGGRTIWRGFDDLHRLKSVADETTVLAQYSYIGPARIARVVRGNGTETEYAYNGDQGPSAADRGVKRIRRIVHKSPQFPLGFDQRDYQYDATQNETSEILLDLTLPTRQNPFSVRSMDYTPSSWLARSTGGPLGPHTYVFDPVGNRTSGPDGNATGPFSMDATPPEPSDRQMNQYTTSPRRTFTHNLNGNLTGINPGNIVLQYNHLDQMVRYQAAGSFYTYQYDPLGRRIAKISNGAMGATVRFFYDGIREIEEQDANGATLATYVYGRYVDEPITMRRGAANYFYHSGPSYSTVAITDEAGSVIERYAYDDYGLPYFYGSTFQTQQAESAIQNPFLFQGRRFDIESGLYHYRLRYMDPCTGRFTTRDPIGGWADTLNLGNASLFVGNNPARWLDPLGLKSNDGSDGGDDECDGLDEESCRALKYCKEHPEDTDNCVQIHGTPPDVSLLNSFFWSGSMAYAGYGMPGNFQLPIASGAAKYIGGYWLLWTTTTGLEAEELEAAITIAKATPPQVKALVAAFTAGYLIGTGFDELTGGRISDAVADVIFAIATGTGGPGFVPDDRFWIDVKLQR